MASDASASLDHATGADAAIPAPPVRASGCASVSRREGDEGAASDSASSPSRIGLGISGIYSGVSGVSRGLDPGNAVPARAEPSAPRPPAGGRARKLPPATKSRSADPNLATSAAALRGHVASNTSNAAFAATRVATASSPNPATRTRASVPATLPEGVASVVVAFPPPPRAPLRFAVPPPRARAAPVAEHPRRVLRDAGSEPRVGGSSPHRRLELRRERETRAGGSRDVGADGVDARDEREVCPVGVAGVARAAALDAKQRGREDARRVARDDIGELGGVLDGRARERGDAAARRADDVAAGGCELRREGRGAAAREADQGGTRDAIRRTRRRAIRRGTRGDDGGGGWWARRGRVLEGIVEGGGAGGGRRRLVRRRLVFVGRTGVRVGAARGVVFRLGGRDGQRRREGAHGVHARAPVRVICAGGGKGRIGVSVRASGGGGGGCRPDRERWIDR